MYFIGEEEIDAIRRVIESKTLFRYQLDKKSECELFEQEVCSLFGTSYALMVTSGTNALIAALLSLGIGPGDEVIIPSYTFVATATAVTTVGAIPIIANIDKNLSISIKEIKSKISNRTKAIIPVHMDGLASPMKDILSLAKEHNLKVIEDCAQAFGGQFEGKFLGTFGEVGCFSLNKDKVISCGEGGLVITNDREIFERLFCIHDASAQFNPVNKDFYQKITPFMGLSMRVSEISGAIMREQLKRLGGILKSLRERKAIFVENLSQLKSFSIPRGHSEAGDCGTTLHFIFSSPEGLQKAGKILRENHIFTFPVSMRPAHTSWKWSKLLGNETSSINKEFNPYNFSEEKYSYSQFEYLSSIEILMSTLKYDIDINLSIEQTTEIAMKIKDILEKDFN